MKMPWLLLMLATLGAFVPEAFAAIEEPRLQPGSGLRRRKCPGCYTHLEQAPPSEDFGRAELSLRPSPSLSSLTELLRPYEERLGAEPALEDSAPIPSLQTKRRRARSACPSCFEPLDTPKGEPTKEDVDTPQLYSTTQPLFRRRRNRTRNFLPGSLSTLSRKPTEDGLIIFFNEEGWNISHPEREAVSARDRCLGCCETPPFPSHPGSRENQPSRGDSGTLGNVPTTAPPRRNGTQGDMRPGAYTPIKKKRKVDSFSATLWTRPREATPTPDRCRGCCGVNTTVGADTPGRREEETRNPRQPHFEDSISLTPSKGNWRPVLDRKDPSQQPSWAEEDEVWSPFSKGAALPLQNYAGQ